MKKKHHNHKLINDLQNKIKELYKQNFALSFILNHDFHKNPPKEEPKNIFRKHAMSEKCRVLIEQRGTAKKERTMAEFERLTLDFRKSRKQDRKDRVIEGLSKELDVRDRWL